MKLICTMPVRNEDWVLGLSARAVLQWCDELVIGLHACADNSASIVDEISDEFPGRVTVLINDNPCWSEMAHRQRLLEIARAKSATHIAIVDADEVLTATLIPYVRQYIERMPEGRTFQLPWLCLRGSIGSVHMSGPWADGQNVTTAFQDAPELHWSAEGRGGYDFHHRHPMGRVCVPHVPLARRTAGLMHLQFVSNRRLRAKQALYKLTEVLRWPGREPVRAVDERYNLSVYGQYATPTEPRLIGTDCTLGPVPSEWWSGYENLLLHHFRPDAEPWQEAEVARLIAEQGRERFAGLDLFGL